jgi:hypothetical protein
VPGKYKASPGTKFQRPLEERALKPIRL